MRTSKCLVLIVVIVSANAWAKVTIHSQQIVEKKEGYYTVSVRYPQISLPVNPGVQQKVNALLKQNAQGTVDAYRADFLGVANPAKNIGVWTLESDYKVEYETDRLLVFSQEGYVYTGGAHGMSLIDALILDLQTGKMLQLKDLFKPRSPYLKLLSDYSRKALATKFKGKLNHDWIQRGTIPTENNFSVVLPTQRGLLVRFPPYQVASFADGIQEVMVPYRALATVLDPAGPLGQYAR